MIEVTIKDTKGNHAKVISTNTETFLSNSMTRLQFVCDTNVMMGEFFRELKEQWKEAKKCQKE